MSSRSDHRRRDRSWERDDRDRDRDKRSREYRGREAGSRSYYDEGYRRPSRSRSPRRGGERDRRGGHGEPLPFSNYCATCLRTEVDRREDDRRDRDRRDDRRKDDGKRRDDMRERDERKDSPGRGNGRVGLRRLAKEEDDPSRTAQPFVASAPLRPRDDTGANEWGLPLQRLS